MERLLTAEYRQNITNSNLSAVLNAIILVRACEDYVGLIRNEKNNTLLTSLPPASNQPLDLPELLQYRLNELPFEIDLSAMFNADRFAPFREFDWSTAHEMLRDFYKPSTSPYDFNFALMSKDAQSRIYERFVSLLEFDDDLSGQLSFLPPIPLEKHSRKTGAVYTPQFIASFFIRYVRENMTPRMFRNVRFNDPACGSGIFARTVLETQSDPLATAASPQAITGYFERAELIDRDPAACEAATLSLTLLFLLLTGSVPSRTNVRCGDAIRLALGGKLDPSSYDMVVANPPYIRYENLSDEERAAYQKYLGAEGIGRVDSYLGFVKLSLALVEPGGFVALVLLQAFLLAENARSLRTRISKEFDVRCIVDLSLVNVFEDMGVYNVLRIVQRRMDEVLGRPDAQVARCQEFAGAALEDCLHDRTIETPYYSVFKVEQGFFEAERWVLLRSREFSLSQKTGKLKPLRNYMEVTQGVNSGADRIFIRSVADIPMGEEEAYRPLLRDRQIFRYQVPPDTDEVMIYPLVNGKFADEKELKVKFPRTWKYLSDNREVLSARKGVPWWRPMRPRDPAKLLRPKIVCPHLMLTPRFVIDLAGRYLISRSPFICPKADVEEETFLKFFCATLNSSVAHWDLAQHAYKYRGGFNRIEVDLLKRIPVPDPAEVEIGVLTALLGLVDRACEGPETGLEAEIHELVATIYGLSDAEKRDILGMKVDE